MSEQTDTNTSDIDLEKEQSKYWFCPDDKNMLQIYYTKQSQNPYFVITRQNIDMGIQNAIALRKIAPEAKEQTREIVALIFEKDPLREEVNLVRVRCNICGASYSAPKLQKIVNGEFSKDRARAMFESTRSLETKHFGPFRVVDHFGVGRFARGGRQSSMRGFFWLWILGIRTILMIIFLYYILGLELKIGKRWLPLGPILFIFGLVAIIFISFYWNIFDVLNQIFTVCY